MDKPKSIIKFSKKIELKNNTCRILLNLDKQKNIEKVVNKMIKKEINNVVLERELFKQKEFINFLNEKDIVIFDGRWLIKYLAFELLDFIESKKGLKKEDIEIAITVNEITDLAIHIIKRVSSQYKKVIVVTNHIDKLKKIENYIYKENGIIIVLTNNKKRSLIKSDIILNIDFVEDVLNKYRINENAVIINLEGNVNIKNKRFNGININDYEIENQKVLIGDDIEKFRTKDIYEALLYTKDTFEHIRKIIEKDNIKIKELYGMNGKIERF